MPNQRPHTHLQPVDSAELESLVARAEEIGLFDSVAKELEVMRAEGLPRLDLIYLELAFWRLNHKLMSVQSRAPKGRRRRRSMASRLTKPTDSLACVRQACERLERAGITPSQGLLSELAALGPTPDGRPVTATSLPNERPPLLSGYRIRQVFRALRAGR